MQTRRWVAILAGLMLVGGAAGASGQTIDFQALAHTDANKSAHGFTYSEQGYTLNNLAEYPFYTYGTQETFNRYPGSTALFNETRNGVTELVRSNGRSFTLNSIDVAELNGNIQPPDHVPYTPLTFVGFFAGGGSVSQSFTLDQYFIPNDIRSFQTFSFSGFTDVVKVYWTQQADYHQFDNIVVTTGGNRAKGSGLAADSTSALMFPAAAAGAELPGGPAPVPAPASMLLIGAGLAGLIAVRGRRNKA